MVNLSPDVKGLLAVGGGIILILHTIDFRGINFNLIIILGAFALIAWGLSKMDAIHRVRKLLKK